MAENLRETVRAVDARLSRLRNEPTRLQVRMVNFIRDYRLRTGAGPTFGEVAAAMGMASKGNIARHVKGLIDRKLVTYSPGQHRSLAAARECPVTLDLPDDLFALLWVLSRRQNVSLEMTMISIVRDWLDGRRSH